MLSRERGSCYEGSEYQSDDCSFEQPRNSIRQLEVQFLKQLRSQKQKVEILKQSFREQDKKLAEKDDLITLLKAEANQLRAAAEALLHAKQQLQRVLEIAERKLVQKDQLNSQIKSVLDQARRESQLLKEQLMRDRREFEQVLQKEAEQQQTLQARHRERLSQLQRELVRQSERDRRQDQQGKEFMMLTKELWQAKAASERHLFLLEESKRSINDLQRENDAQNANRLALQSEVQRLRQMNLEQRQDNTVLVKDLQALGRRFSQLQEKQLADKALNARLERQLRQSEKMLRGMDRQIGRLGKQRLWLLGELQSRQQSQGQRQWLKERRRQLAQRRKKEVQCLQDMLQRMQVN